MFQSEPRRAVLISHSLELNVCTLVGQERNGMSTFCQQLFWLKENFSFFSFQCESHGEFIWGGHQKKKWKAVKEKKILLTSMLVLFPLENGLSSSISGYHFFFLFNYWIFHMEHAQMEWALFRPYSERRYQKVWSAFLTLDMEILIRMIGWDNFRE